MQVFFWYFSFLKEKYIASLASPAFPASPSRSQKYLKEVMKLEKRKKHIADIILIASLILISAIAITVLLTTRQSGTRVVVELDGKEIAEYSLSKDGEYTLNGGTNTLIIKDNKAYVTNSHCPDKTCEKTGKISYVGESITCLPNKLSVRIDGEGGVDLVS